MFEKIIKKIFGAGITEDERTAQLAQLDQEIADVDNLIEQAKLLEEKRAKKEAKTLATAERRQAKKEFTGLTPKEVANKRKEPWVDVLSFKVNQDNIRNGFYELDWNDYFILELKREGYGYDGDPDEEIVDRWFRDICLNAAAETGVDLTDRSTGYVNLTKLTGGKAEVK